MKTPTYMPPPATTIMDLVGHSLNPTSRGHNTTHEIRFCSPKNAEGKKTEGQELSTKPHGIFSKTIRLFGAYKKDDMADNQAIKERFKQEMLRDYPVMGHDIMVATGFLKLNKETNTYEFKNLEPLTTDQVVRLVRYGNHYERQDFNTERKDFLGILKDWDKRPYR